MKVAALVFGSALLAQSSGALDLNSNGMSDVWEKKYPAQAAAPGLDSDGDGWTNQEESTFGTDPGDRLSRAYLELTPGAAPEEFPVRIETAPGKRYDVVTSYDLASWSSLLSESGPPLNREWSADHAFHHSCAHGRAGLFPLPSDRRPGCGRRWADGMGRKRAGLAR